MATTAQEPSQTNSNERPHTVIVGGSIAGLFSAQPLLKAGHNVTILERATSYSSASTQASGISMGPYVQQYLKRFDRFSDEPLYLPTKGMNFLNPDGSIKRTIDHVGYNVSWGGIWARMRRNFDAVNEEEEGATSGVKRAEYRTGVAVTGVTCNAGRYVVHFKDTGSSKKDGDEDEEDETDKQQQSNSEDAKGDAEPLQTLEADFLIAADGANSIVKRALTPSTSHNYTDYTGYVAWRGTVLESNVSEATSSLFQGRICSVFTSDGYILVYHVPGPRNALEPGQRVLNFVWYSSQTPSAVQDILTDKSGSVHRRSIPAGQLRDEIWTQQRAVAEKSMPSAFLELIRKVEKPFVQVIEDAMASSPLFQPNLPVASSSQSRPKPPPVLLAGESLAVLRPNTAQGVNMIARGALFLADAAEGKMSLQEAANTFYCELVTTRYHAMAFGDFFIKGAVGAIWGSKGLVVSWLASRWAYYTGGFWPAASEGKGLDFRPKL